jgi:hypothetical protein
VNRALGRRGAVWNGRYHARALRTPREVRHAQASGPRLVAVARTWLARVGWRRYGLIDRGERPKVASPKADSQGETATAPGAARGRPLAPRSPGA